MYQKKQLYLWVIMEKLIQLIWYFFWIILLVRQRSRIPRHL